MGETDISGLGLREAHLRLDWAADGLDLTSSNIGSSYPYTHTHSPARHLSPHTHTTLSHKATYAVCTQTLSRPHSPYKRSIFL